MVNDTLAAPSARLDPVTRETLGARLGADFSSVRLHVDSRAAQSAAMLHARAYTVGHDIVFAQGAYAPQSRAGRRLLAHELAHTLRGCGAGICRSAADEAQPDLDLQSRAERRLARFEYKDKLAEIKAELHGRTYQSKLGGIDQKSYHELLVLAAEIAGGCRDGVCSDERWALIQEIVSLLLPDPPEPLPGDPPPQATLRETYRAPALTIDMASEPGVVVIYGPELPIVRIPIVEITTVVVRPQVVVVEPKVNPDPGRLPTYVEYPPPFPAPVSEPDDDIPTIEWGKLEDVKLGGCSGLDEPSKIECEMEIDTLFDPSSLNPLSAKVTANSEGAWLVVEVTPKLGQLLELPGAKLKVPLKFCKDCRTPWSAEDLSEYGGLIEGADQARLDRYFELMEEYANTGRRPLDPLIDIQMPVLPPP